jgi:xanthine/CO dehydrogenase XdhC/CoxF family maturation factor
MAPPREQAWSDEPAAPGRILVLSDNPIATAIKAIANAIGRAVVVIADDETGAGLTELRRLGPTDADAVVLCDHDAPDARDVLRAALDGPARYVAMMASRRRSETVLAELRDEGYTEQLERLHLPAGLNIGGKSPGEIALSVVAEVVADANGRPGGPMNADL